MLFSYPVDTVLGLSRFLQRPDVSQIGMTLCTREESAVWWWLLLLLPVGTLMNHHLASSVEI